MPVKKPFVVALEEHYTDREVASHFRRGGEGGALNETSRRLVDLGELRLKEMDAGGIDFQVIGHSGNTTERLNAETAVELASRANDRLHEQLKLHPDRFAGFAMLPTPDPAAAADELERTVTRHGFKGAMLHGLTNGEFLDHRKYWPIFERAAALGVPLYMHPALPHPAVVDAYYRDYAKDFPAITSAAWGYNVEAGTQAIRMILSGVFDAYPALKIIIGHMGELLPFSLWRIEEVLSHPENKQIAFKDEFCEHFYITTSGNFSTSALLCSIMEIGVDKVLFSVDWPYIENERGTRWLEGVPLSDDDKARIFGGNAKKLLRL